MSDNQSSFLDRSWKASKIAVARTFRPPRCGAGTDHTVFPRSKAFCVVLLLAVIATIACFFWIDLPAAMRARQFYSEVPQILYFFKQLTKLGSSGWILVLSGTLALYLSATRWNRYPRADRLKLANLHADAAFMFFVIASTGISVWLVKNMIGRARPKLLESMGHLHFDVAAFQSKFASFPSGHATTTGALAFALALLLPKWRWIWVAIGITAGFSRVVVGAHYPADVVAGLVIGAVATWLTARFLAKRGVMFRQRSSFLPVRVRRPAKR